MTADGQDFLKELANFAPTTFEGRFFKTSARLELGSALSGGDLMLLYEAAFYATLCNIAFNGLGGCGGKIKPSKEANRLSLEHAFMGARNKFFSSAGWAALPDSKRGSIERIFLQIFVAPDNLS
jgi:hypothetical protein